MPGLCDAGIGRTGARATNPRSPFAGPCRVCKKLAERRAGAGHPIVSVSNPNRLTSAFNTRFACVWA